MLKPNIKSFSGVLYVNRKRFAAGLFWQPVGVGYTPRGYAKFLAKNSSERARLFVEYRSMIGLAFNHNGYVYGMPACAPEIVDSLSEYSSFLAVFHIDRRFYLVAVRNGIILADKLFDTDADARAEFTKFMQIPDWGMLIAPNSWAIPRAIDRNLGAILMRKTKYHLRAINLWHSRFLSFVLLVVFFWCIYMFFKVPINQMREKKSVNIDPELAAEYKRQVDEKYKELDTQFEIKKQDPVKPLVMPYSVLPVPEQRAKQCYQAIGFLMQPITGWTQSTVVCDETRATAEFNRTFGSLDDFYQMAADFMPGANIVEMGDNTIQVSVALPEVARAESLDSRDAATVERNVVSLFQTIRTNVKTEIVVDTLTNGVDTANLNIVEIAAASKLMPMQFTKMFDDYGGFFMTRCVWNALSRTWNYEVIIYAK